MVAPNSLIGTTLEVVSGEPATYDETGYDALSMTEVLGVQSIGELGDESERIAVKTLKDGRVQYANGTKDFPPFPIQFLPDATDAGQVIIAAANNTNTLHSILIEKPSGRQIYLTGRFANLKETGLDPDSVDGRMVEFRPAYAPVYGTA